MKKQSLINLTAGAVLVFGPLSASATEFGSGWMRDKNSGTLYNANAPTVEQSSSQRSDAYKNSFGGGWAHDTCDTLYKSDMPAVDSQQHAGSKGSVSGSVWAKNYMFGAS
jgi:hypothetical protein